MWAFSLAYYNVTHTVCIIIVIKHVYLHKHIAIRALSNELHLNIISCTSSNSHGTDNVKSKYCLPGAQTIRSATMWWTWMPTECGQPIAWNSLAYFRRAMVRRQSSYDLRHAIQPTPTTVHRSMPNFLAGNANPIISSTRLSIMKIEKDTRN